MTLKTALAFGIGASLILAAGTASADCASEVQALEQQIGADTSTEMSATGTTTESGAAATGTSEEGTAVNPTYSSNDPGEPAEHDQQATSGTTSSEIVDDTMASESSSTMGTGTTGTGTITETTRTGEVDATAESRAAAIASLEQAKLYADAGDEAACMSELSTAKQHMGVQ